MPFRRNYTRFSRRFGGYRRSRFSSAVRSPTRAGQGRWQWGNIHFNQTFTTQAPGSVSIFAELASLNPAHYGDLTLGTAQVVTQSNMIKCIDIGGVVFNSGIHFSQINIDAENGPLSGRFLLHQMLVLDRVDNTGVPQGVFAPWHISSFPTLTVDGTIPRPTTAEEIRDYPSRILWRSATYINPSLIEFNNASAEDISTARQNEVYNPQRSKNIRVRKRLADDYGLFYVAAATPIGSIASNHVLTTWFTGSLYYRVRH